MIECKLLKEANRFRWALRLGTSALARGCPREPLSGVRIEQKSLKHSPANKLTDALMGILSGCKALYETNIRVRPDVPLCKAFGRERCAEQSTIQRTLDAFSEENVHQLREAVEEIGGRYSRLSKHPTTKRCSSWRWISRV
jgi:hypothetical protein